MQSLSYFLHLLYLMQVTAWFLSPVVPPNQVSRYLKDPLRSREWKLCTEGTPRTRNAFYVHMFIPHRPLVRANIATILRIAVADALPLNSTLAVYSILCKKRAQLHLTLWLLMGGPGEQQTQDRTDLITTAKIEPIVPSRSGLSPIRALERRRSRNTYHIPARTQRTVAGAGRTGQRMLPNIIERQ